MPPKTQNRKIPEVFLPDDIVASSLMLVGYKLFPATTIALHPRMTVLSGNNAVGKTTILDAVQTILICHQQYINLNVATGQFDRSLSGQLSGRVGWAILSVTGHKEITAIGVRLHAKATSDSLELNPFVLTGIAPGTELFLDRESSQVTPDFQALKKNILTTDIQGQAQDFASVDEYHRYLFSQGLLPVAMDRQGKKKFATLWSQVTRPKLDRLGVFLKEMLCPDPAQGVKFADVERLMSDRRRLSEQLRALEKFRRTRQELEEGRKHLDDRRSLYLSTELGRQQSRIRACTERMRQQKQKERDTVLELQRLEKELEEAKAAKDSLSKERDKYLSRQSELSRQQRHHEDYLQAVQEQASLQNKLQEISRKRDQLQQQADQAAQDLKERQNEVYELHSQVSGLKERLKYLKADKDKYEQLQKLLKAYQDKTGTAIRNWTDLQKAWTRVQKDKARLDNLPQLERRLTDLGKRVESHSQARNLARWLEQNHPESAEVLKKGRQALEGLVLQWEELDFEACIARSSAELDKLDKQIADLEKGRPSLPEAISRQADSGKLSLVASRFEHLDLEQAAEVQARLGPFARGVLINDPSEVAGLDLGEEEFLLLKREVRLEDFDSVSSGQGHISGHEGLYWYAPEAPVWLGAQARARELQRLSREREAAAGELERLRNERQKNRERIQQARQLVAMWQAFEDRACIAEHKELQEEVSLLRKDASGIQDRYRQLASLVSKKEHFDLQGAPREYARVRKECREKEHRLQELEKNLQAMEQDLADKNKELSGLDRDFASEDKKLAGAQARLEGLLQEEPRDVLEGRIDFSEARVIQERISSLEQELAGLDKTRDNLHRDSVRKAELLKQIQKELEKLDQEVEEAGEAEQLVLERWQKLYPQQPPEYRSGNYSYEDASRLRLEWEMAESQLGRLIQATASEYSLQLPPEAAPEAQVDMILDNIIPTSVELDRVEDQFQRLRQELGEIEARIKSYVQDIRQKVDQEISKLKRRLDKVNSILADIRFGRISQVRIELAFLPQYENLKKLKGETLSLLDFGSQTTLQEFVQELVKNIFRRGRADVSEDQIADYRTYIDLSWSITDLDGESRQKGFSGGETLGINLAICLGLLFHWGGEAGQAQARGLLIMALDEAERLDEQAVYTVRELLDRAGSQLMVALPRTIEVPDTICHMLTPLEQGVTHVSVYHKG